MVFLYALRVSGFHCCRANVCTICSVVTSSGPDGMSSAARCTILYRRLLIVCADRPAALRVSVHPSMLLRHGTGALILFLMIHHGHPDPHAAKLSLDKLRSPMDLNLGPLVSPEVQGSNPCPATNVVIWPLISVPKSAAFPFTVAIWMKGDQAATVPREVGDHKRLVIFIADLQLSNPREATGVKFLNEAEAGHKSYVTIDFVPSSRSSAQKRSVVHHPADIIGIMPQRVNVSASASSSA